MNKQKERQLKELQNKYFWKQKFEEVFGSMFIVGGIIWCWYIASSIVLMISPKGICDSLGCMTDIFTTGLVGLLGYAIGVLAIWGIYELGKYILKAWIENNEYEARKRAKIELGIKPDKRGDY